VQLVCCTGLWNVPTKSESSVIVSLWSKIKKDLSLFNARYDENLNVKIVKLNPNNIKRNSTATYYDLRR
jgi:hypothetical protein